MEDGTVPLASTRRTGLVDQVIDQMRQAIAAGEWPVGDRIPPEPELAAALAVGRNTVREAVRALAHGGLLEVRQGDGTFVRATSELSGALRKLWGSELVQALEVRRALEVEAARLAATRRTAAQLRTLRRQLRDRDTAQRDGDTTAFLSADTALHSTVVECAHNPLLEELYRGLNETVRASVAATMDQPADEVSHDGLVQAIADRDPAAAMHEAGCFLDELLRKHS